jgi:hypothetical protein
VLDLSTMVKRHRTCLNAHRLNRTRFTLYSPLPRPASLRSDVDSHPTGILIHITGIGNKYRDPQIRF